MATTNLVLTIKVLFILYPGMDAIDFVSPLEVLTHARHNINSESKYYKEMRIGIALILPFRALFYPAFGFPVFVVVSTFAAPQSRVES